MNWSSPELVEDYIFFVILMWFLTLYVIEAFWHPPHYRLRSLLPGSQRRGHTPGRGKR